MIPIIVPECKELWDPVNNEFLRCPKTELKLEHSLVSISKWEAKWKIPFLTDKKKTNAQIFDYISDMTLNEYVDPVVYRCLTKENVEDIKKYLSDPMSATTFSSNEQKKFSREVITSELIYYWMTFYGIPFECENWPIRRLLNLIKICSIKSSGEKKMSKKESADYYQRLNKQRRAALHSKG